MIPHADVNPGVGCAIAGPKGEAAKTYFGCFIMPDLRAGFGIYGEDAVRAIDVHDAIDDYGNGFSARLAGVEGPGALEAGDVGRIDLVERRIAGGGRVVAEHGPVSSGVRGSVGRRGERGGDKKGGYKRGTHHQISIISQKWRRFPTLGRMRASRKVDRYGLAGDAE